MEIQTLAKVKSRCLREMAISPNWTLQKSLDVVATEESSLRLGMLIFPSRRGAPWTRHFAMGCVMLIQRDPLTGVLHPASVLGF